LKPAVGWDSPLVSSKIIDVDGLRVLSVGLITDEYFPYGDYPWLDYIAPEDALRREIESVEDPVDLIVVVAHIPVADTARIAVRVSDVDVFVTGHSHEETPEPVIVGRYADRAVGRYLGKLLIDVDEGGVSLIENDLLPTETAPADLRQGEFRLVEVLLLFGIGILCFFL